MIALTDRTPWQCDRDHQIGDTIRIVARVRRVEDGVPVTLPAIAVLTLTSDLVRRELARQQRSQAKKKPRRKARASVPRRSTR